MITTPKKANTESLRAQRGGEGFGIVTKTYAVVEALNGYLSDVLALNMPVIVKRCQARVHRSGTRSGQRYGRFVFIEAEHEYLRGVGGLYLLIVSYGCNAMRLRIIPALALDFVAQRSWHELFGEDWFNALHTE